MKAFQFAALASLICSYDVDKILVLLKVLDKEAQFFNFLKKKDS